MHFRHPTDEQLRHVDIYFLATKIICSLSTLNLNILICKSLVKIARRYPYVISRIWAPFGAHAMDLEG